MSSKDDQRSGSDRRRKVMLGLLVGSFHRRRRHPRRARELHFAAIDWHHPQWLAVAMLIVLLSVADAFLTLTLLDMGATEANPFMAPLVAGSGHSFAYWKLGLTSGGVILLTVLARLHVFGRIPVAGLLYSVLGMYCALVGYEVWLLDRARFGFLELP